MGSQQGRQGSGALWVGVSSSGRYWRLKTGISLHCSLAEDKVSLTSKDGEGPGRDQGVLTASCSLGSPSLSLPPGEVTTHGAPAAAVLASGESGAP